MIGLPRVRYELTLTYVGVKVWQVTLTNHNYPHVVLTRRDYTQNLWSTADGHLLMDKFMTRTNTLWCPRQLPATSLVHYQCYYRHAVTLLLWFSSVCPGPYLRGVTGSTPRNYKNFFSLYKNYMLHNMWPLVLGQKPLKCQEKPSGVYKMQQTTGGGYSAPPEP